MKGISDTTAVSLMLLITIGLAGLVYWYIEEAVKPTQQWSCVEWKNETICSASVHYYNDECDKWAKYLGLQFDDKVCHIDFVWKDGEVVSNVCQQIYSKCLILGQEGRCETKQTCVREGLNCEYPISRNTSYYGLAIGSLNSTWSDSKKGIFDDIYTVKTPNGFLVAPADYELISEETYEHYKIYTFIIIYGLYCEEYREVL